MDYGNVPKLLGLKNINQKNTSIDENTKSRMDNGNIVGDLAMQLFGDYNEVTTYTNNKLDIPKMIEKTKQYMIGGRDNICEASFNYNGLYCAVDILRKQDNGYAIYEVKSSTHEDNYIYNVGFGSIAVNIYQSLLFLICIG